MVKISCADNLYLQRDQQKQKIFLKDQHKQKVFLKDHFCICFQKHHVDKILGHSVWALTGHSLFTLNANFSAFPMSSRCWACGHMGIIILAIKNQAQ